MTKKVTTIARKPAKKINKPRITQAPDIEKIILDRVSLGESLNVICTGAGMPTRKSVYEWLKHDAVFRAAYEFAISMRAEKMAEEIVEISDEQPPRDCETGKIDSAWVAWQKNRVDARKWTASRLLPKKYGDKVAIGGAEDLPPVQITEIITRIVGARN
jgi:hypothetical protein